MNKKIFIGGILTLLVLSSMPIVVGSEEKPDLIVDGMGFAPYGDSGLEDISYATIKNIGDVEAKGTIYLRYTFTRMLFGIIPIKIVQSDTDSIYSQGGVEPEHTIDFFLIYEFELPKFGFFKFKCTVNPGKTMEESNYDNNDLSKDYVAFLGIWIERG